MPADTYELLRQGESLSDAEAQQLEEHLRREPNDVEATHNRIDRPQVSRCSEPENRRMAYGSTTHGFARGNPPGIR